MIRLLLSPPPNLSLKGLAAERLAQLPVDRTNVREYGDDTARHEKRARKRKRRKVPKRPGPRVVPFVRELSYGKRGDDVVAVQRALQRAGIRKMRPTGVYGVPTLWHVRAFQRREAMIAASGRYNRPTHQKLLQFFDAYGAWLMQARSRRAHPPEEQLRQRIASVALFAVAVRAEIHYSQGPRRMEWLRLLLRPPHFPAHTDCSAWADWVYWVAGAPDPAGQDFRLGGTVYTGTMAEHGRKVSRPATGDLGLHGPAPTYSHVDVYVGEGRRVSHGREAGPELVVADYWKPVVNRTYV